MEARVLEAIDRLSSLNEIETDQLSKCIIYYRPLRGLFIDEASFSMYIATTNYSVWNLPETPVQN